MSFVFMVLHWPEPGNREELARSMRAMKDALLELPGCLGVDPPYYSPERQCLVGISRWQSREAFLASGITLRPADEILPGELRPRERFLLDEAVAP